MCMRMLGTPPRLLANANTARLDNPEATRDRLLTDEGQGSPERGKRVLNALCLWPEYPDSTVAGWWVLSNICEVEIQRDMDSIFVQANIENLRVRTVSKAFVVNGVRVVPGGEQQCLRIARDVLVKLETCGHPLRLCSRDMDHPFASEIRGIGNGRRNVLRFEGRVLIQYALWRLAVGKIVQNDRYWDPRTFEAHGAVHDLWISSYVGLPVHRDLQPSAHEYNTGSPGVPNARDNMRRRSEAEPRLNAPFSNALLGR